MVTLSKEFRVPTVTDAVAAAIKCDDADKGVSLLKENRFAFMVAIYITNGKLDPKVGLAPYKDELVRQLRDRTGSAKVAMPGWFRSNLSVISTSIEAGLELLRPDGTPKGKTELEKERAALKDGKTPMEKFIRDMAAAETHADNLDDADDIEAALTLARNLVESLEDLAQDYKRKGKTPTKPKAVPTPIAAAA